MKRIIFIILALFYFSLSVIAKPVYAYENKYYRVLQENVYIYSDQNLSQPLFIVPYTYYVKAEYVNGTTARVVYGNDDQDYPVIIGYMDLNELTVSELSPVNPYAVTKVSSSTQDVLFNDVDKKKAYFNVPAETFMIYYGEIKDKQGSVMCMVYLKNKLGYIDKNCLNSFSIPLNSDPLPKPDEPEEITPSDTDNIEKPTAVLGENLQIIIIVGISTVCISVVYFLFKPTKNKTSKKTEYFEEGE